MPVRTIRRSRPALGTLVEFGVEGADAAAAVRAIDAAFAEVRTVHKLMSFHEPQSDLARLHRATPGTAVRVNARTHEVLACALRIAAASNGCFDPTVAGEQVERGLLPPPDSAFAPDPAATWRDVEMLGGERVRLGRPLWIDLGGIAKGYAVDRAIEVLRAHGVEQACVNAGGDLRVFGPRPLPVRLRCGSHEAVDCLELADASIATSAGASALLRDGASWSAAVPTRTVSVVAACCVIADALTKVVLAADSACASRVLARFSAQACVHDERIGWKLLAVAA